jgi:hypothetical protein
MHISVSITVFQTMSGNFTSSSRFNAAYFIKMSLYCFEEGAIIILKTEC